MNAQARFDTDPVVDQVLQAAIDECGPEGCLIYPVLEECARQGVDRYANSRLLTFVPLLAVRHVRDCIRNGRCEGMSGFA